MERWELGRWGVGAVVLRDLWIIGQVGESGLGVAGFSIVREFVLSWGEIDAFSATRRGW